jgi:hypothetical protein
MNERHVSDEVTDAIAFIEVHRQDAVRESGMAHACSEALRKLHELLEQVRAEAQQRPDANGHSPNLEAVNQEIRKVKSLAGNAGHNNGPRHQHGKPKQHQPQGHPPRSGAPHGQGQGQGQGPGRNKGRRSMGRSSNGGR